MKVHDQHHGNGPKAVNIRPILSRRRGQDRPIHGWRQTGNRSAGRKIATQGIAPHATLPNRCRPLSLAGSARPAISANTAGGELPFKEIQTRESQNQLSNRAFATPWNRPPAGLKNHQKLLFIQ